jgi:hypothetical protein
MPSISICIWPGWNIGLKRAPIFSHHDKCNSQKEEIKFDLAYPYWKTRVAIMTTLK